MKIVNFHEFHGISGLLRFRGAQKWVDSEPCPAPSRLKEINRGFSILNGKEGGGGGFLVKVFPPQTPPI